MWRRLSVVAAVAAAAAFPTGATGAPGDLDPTFGGDGTVVVDVGHRTAHASDIAAMDDGRVVTVGASAGLYERRADIAVIRYLPDGRLDSSFGGDGVVRTDVMGKGDDARAVAIQSDGRIVVAGSAYGPGLAARLVVLRYLPDGSLDRTFGRAGMRRLGTRRFPYCGVLAEDIALTPEGGIVIVGTGGCGGESDEGTATFLARLTADGRLDRGFSGNGVFSTWASCYASSVGVLADGAIVFAGEAGYPDYCNGPMFLGRLRRDGTWDTTFGMRGRVRISFPNYNSAFADDLAVGSGGQVVLAGQTDGISARTGLPRRTKLALARVDAGGTLDTSFGAGGRQVSGVPGFRFAGAAAIRQAPDGRLLVAASARPRFIGPWSRFVVRRYEPSGVVDPTFGSGGLRTVSFGTKNAGAEAVAIATDGAIVAAGSAGRRADTDIAVARLLP